MTIFEKIELVVGLSCLGLLLYI